jgi:hypothetical protein
MPPAAAIISIARYQGAGGVNVSMVSSTLRARETVEEFLKALWFRFVDFDLFDLWHLSLLPSPTAPEEQRRQEATMILCDSSPIQWFLGEIV